MKKLLNLLVAVCLMLPSSQVLAQASATDKTDETKGDESTSVPAADRIAARDAGLDWLTKNQAADGSWGKTYTIAITSFACLSYLAGSDEPFSGDRGRALVKGLNFLMAYQENGQFIAQGHTWIHGQGFATLALSEAYGRSLVAKTKPDINIEAIREVVGNAVQVIAKNQSTSGGWWYTPGTSGSHEGSTTVCAVQAMVSAGNYDIEIDKTVLNRGFEYLKKCQNPDGGFDYKLGDSQSMKEGTAGGVATLGLMKKFDYSVMVEGYKYLLKITPATISRERFPYYGHFYGCMGMHLLRQEFGRDEEYRKKTSQYIDEAQHDILSWKQENGAWPAKAWVVSSAKEGEAYGTAFATLTLSIAEGRLSIYNRRPRR